MKTRILLVLFIFAVLLVPPLLLRSAREKAPVIPLTDDPDTERLVILSPHNDATKDESARAFRKHYLRKYGKKIIIDYRAPGGTSDIMKFIADRFKIEFRPLLEKEGIPWNSITASAFSDPNILKDRRALPEAAAARKLFLNSNCGIGVDLVYGGGVFEFARNAEQGYAVDAEIARTDPELLDPELLPFTFGGEQLYDPKGRYYGICLSTFGICCNTDRIREAGFRPTRWKDLGDHRFCNQILVADPTKSGSANKCFEIIVQQCMAETPDRDQGWANGLNLLKRIIANAAFCTDGAGRVAREVAAGTAACGMAIDTYGFTEREWNERRFQGKSHFEYIEPEGGTAVSSDTVQLLRGAPNRRAAVEFIRFLLSPEGQKILCFKPGVPGGPEKQALRRPPIRRDMYDGKYAEFRSDPNYNPYRSGASFRYRAELTGRYFTLLRVTIRTIMLDCDTELKEAWREITLAGGPDAVPEAMKHFNRLPYAYHEAPAAKAALSDRTGPLAAVRVRRQWRDSMREEYRKARDIARTARLAGGKK